MDATIANDGNLATQCVPMSPIQYQDAGGCPTSPSAPVSPPSSASGTGVMGSNGQTLTIVDGYATIEEDVSTGPLYTTYTSSLSFVFTDYANALGYAVGSAVKEGSREVDIYGTSNFSSLRATSSVGYPQFTPGSYGIGSGESESLVGYTSTTYCTSQTEGLSTFAPTLTITAISNARIQGSFVDPGSPLPDGGRPFSINFDIPVVVFCNQRGFGGYTTCCLP
jgi:hypothetical protein